MVKVMKYDIILVCHSFHMMTIKLSHHHEAEKTQHMVYFRSHGTISIMIISCPVDGGHKDITTQEHCGQRSMTHATLGGKISESPELR